MHRKAPRVGVLSWLMFDWAAQPWFTLITTFVFGPYFASRLVADPVEGQALWGYGAAVAGLIIAFLSPVLGAVADASGARKPWIAVFSVMIIGASASLWFAAPGVEGAVMLALAAFVIGTVGTEFATVFTNAMMPNLVGPDRLGRLSGTGWAIGYVGGCVALVLMLGFIVADPRSGLTIFGHAPAFGLDGAAHEGDRASGPFTALWYLIFVLPLFLFTPDLARRMPVRRALLPGLRGLRETLRGLRGERDMRRFLLANMVYTDGINALVVFGAIYAASLFGWSATELGVFGLLIILCGVFGCLIGGWLDDRIGAKPVVLFCVLALGLASILSLSMAPDRMFFIVPVEPAVPGDGLFAATGERVYLGIGVLVGFTVGPALSSSRSLLAQLASRESITQHFGLLALSGRVTSFVGPLAIGLLTTISGSQRIGVSVIVLFFIAGALLLAGVSAKRPGVSAGSAASR